LNVEIYITILTVWFRKLKKSKAFKLFLII